MKRSIISIVFFVAFVCSNAQQYHPLIKTNTTWDQYYNILPVFCYTYGERVFFEDHDTVINGLTYKVCMSQQIIQINPGPYCPPFEIDSMSFIVAFLREDTIARRVFINSSQTGGLDELLYDFSLNVGDTLHSTYLGNGETIVIEAVEEMILNNGEIRKQFVVNSQLNSSYTEGIGNSFGLFTQIPVSFCECAGGYFCIKQDGTSILGLGGYCDFQYVGVRNFEWLDFEISPNPVIDKFKIKIPTELLGSSFELYNLLGHEYLRKTLNNSITEFDISNLQPGLYLYSFGSEPNLIQGKLMKK
jgi:hypothetical protein